MNCPICGLESTTDQQFCRKCGADLQPGIRTRTNWVIYGFILMFAGVAIGVIGKRLLQQDIVTVIGVLIALAGMFLSALPYLSPSRSRKYAGARLSQLEALEAAEPTRKLPEMNATNFIPASVTEGTTELL